MPATPQGEAGTTPGAAVAPEGFVLGLYSRETFLEDRAGLLDRLATAPDGPGDRTAALAQARMDLAEFFVAHVLRAEARSILDAAGPGDLGPRQTARWHALDAAVTILGPDTAPLPAPGNPLAVAEWPDRPFWAVLDAIRRRDVARAAPDLGAAFALLDSYPAPLVEHALPLLLELAIEVEDWALAHDIAARFDAYPILRAGPAHPFLLGLAAERTGQLLLAFDSYADAAERQGPYAQRARLALVGIGQATGTIDDAEAREMLTAIATGWRGGPLSLRALQALAELDRSRDAPVAALQTLGRVIEDFAGEEAAALARQQARSLIRDYYRDGASGRIGASQFMTGHRQIGRYYEFEPGFDAEAESWADRMHALGATSLAADEYAALSDRLSLKRDLEIEDVPPARLDALRLKRIAALLDGGQTDPAAELIDRGLDTADPALSDQLAALEVRLGRATGRTADLRARPVSARSTAHRRLLAEADFAAGDWAGARDGFAALWQAGEGTLTSADAVRLFLAAYRSGDTQLARRAAATFPDLALLPQYGDIAADLTEPEDALLPLRRAEALDRVQAAGRTLDRLREIEAARTQ
ncbi:hypothetical protein [Mesobaculum littorinae]|uniref:hypothetical protein n=1 Tax=Mesobaculum littorinae TaxID=2486419 RepID=UPI0019D4A278|nr:hypothetical protein [Mesobaculum littorinae]